MAVADFVRGAMEADLGRRTSWWLRCAFPRFSRAARFGFHKICRKTGEFADAIGVAVHDPDRRYRGLRPAPALALRSSSTPGICISDRGQPPDTADLQQRLVQAGLVGDAYDLKLHAVAVRRAVAQVLAA